MKTIKLKVLVLLMLLYAPLAMTATSDPGDCDFQLQNELDLILFIFSLRQAQCEADYFSLLEATRNIAPAKCQAYEDQDDYLGCLRNHCLDNPTDLVCETESIIYKQFAACFDEAWAESQREIDAAYERWRQCKQENEEFDPSII